MTLRTLLLIAFFSLSSLGAKEQLKLAGIMPIMEEIFGYHVEHQDFSPLLARRAFKVYIEQFDPEKVYLMEEEAAPFLTISDSEAQLAIQRWHQGDYLDFCRLNQVCEQAISRARLNREEIERELLLQSVQPEASGESYLYFATTPEQLRARAKKQLMRVIYAEQKRSSTPFSPEQKERAFALWERRFQHVEEAYLILDKQGKWRQKGESEEYLSLHILKAMAKSLDAHTSFYSSDEAFEIRASLEKEFQGVGVVLREGIDGIVIEELIKGGPAERSGKIEAGDILIQINGVQLGSLPYDKVLDLLKSSSSKSVQIAVRKKDSQGELVVVQLQRERIVMQDERLQFTAEPYADGIIGKLTLPSFYESSDESSCERDIREAIKDLKRQGNLLGLVLDLRENSGGFLNQAVKVAGLFITSGVVVISKYAEGEIQYLRDIDGRLYFNGPMLILTSKASASAAEIVAQALQDYGTALVVGDERTYGKGSIQYQTVTDPAAKAFFKVTVGKYYTVSGKSTQIDGVKADIVVQTPYSAYTIGERYLEYPLESDRISAAFVDPLTDVEPKNKTWFQKNYLPNVQKRDPFLGTITPVLKENSRYRLERDKNFQTFLKALDEESHFKASQEQKSWGEGDLQMTEAVRIIKDMVVLKRQRDAELVPAKQK